MCLSATVLNGFQVLGIVCLNPCYVGCASRLNLKEVLLFTAIGSLNPCYVGCASRLVF